MTIVDIWYAHFCCVNELPTIPSFDHISKAERVGPVALLKFDKTIFKKRIVIPLFENFCYS